MPRSETDGRGVIAELNDLLRLDREALRTYAIALGRLARPDLRAAVERFRLDHERHVSELSLLIRERGGEPTQTPHAAGALTLALRPAAALGGDRAVLLAFKANEREVRDRYRRAAAASHEPDVMVVLGRAAADEARHYAWTVRALADLGAGRRTVAGRVEAALEAARARLVASGDGSAPESARRSGRVRSRWPRARRSAAVVLAVGSGLLAAHLVRRRLA